MKYTLVRFISILTFFFLPGLLLAESNVVSWNATWRFDQSSSEASLNWMQPGFDDSSWPQGQAVFLAPATEPLPAGHTPGTTLNMPATLDYRAYYFRIHFTNALDPATSLLQFSNLLDDGAVFYLNGQEIYRVAMPDGAVDSATRSPRANDLGQHGFYDNFTVRGTNLLLGENVLAVEVHQGGATSSDFVFGLAAHVVPPVAPFFIEHPEGTNLLQGRNITLQADAEGVPPPSYQWFFQNSPIAGATQATYMISAMSPAQAGNYYVRATNFHGYADSTVAVVTYGTDDVGPIPIWAYWKNNTEVLVTFNEALAAESLDPFFYSIRRESSSLDVVAVSFEDGVSSSNTIILRVNPARDQTALYTLDIETATDIYGNQLEFPSSLRIAAPFIVLPYNSSWRYNQSGADLGTAWKEPTYDETGWLSGQGVFAQEPDPSAELALLLGEDLQAPSEGGPITIYFRTRFSAPPNGVLLFMNYFYDDAFVAYLNGKEVLRIGVPTNHNHLTLGSDHEESGASGPVTLPTSLLVGGDNVLAVELHNLNQTSSDAVWGAQLTVASSGVIDEFCTITTSPPTSQTIQEGGSVILSVQVSGLQPTIFQWQRNGVDLPGATNSVLVVTNARPLADGGRYRVHIFCFNGGDTSRSTTLTVLPDTLRPTLLSAIGGTNPTEVILSFSEALDAATAQQIEHYIVKSWPGAAPLSIISATLTNLTSVVLRTEARLSTNYQVTVNGVDDTAETPNSILPNTTAPVLNTIVLVNENASWRYNERNVDLGKTWFAPHYDDSTWSQGTGLFGLEPDAVARGFIINTPLQLTFPPGTNQTSTYYFRTRFNLGTHLASARLFSRLAYDDGVILYLNGNETWRSPSLSTNPVTHATLAASREATAWDLVPLDATHLILGENVLAVELHQTSPTSTDVLLGCVLEAVTIYPGEFSALHIRRVSTMPNSTVEVEVAWDAAPGFVLAESDRIEGPYLPIAGNPQGTYRTTSMGSTRYFRLIEQDQR